MAPKRYGKERTPNYNLLSFHAFLWRLFLQVPRCMRKCFTASPSCWVASREENGVLTVPLSDSVPHFGLHTGKEASLLASKPTDQAVCSGDPHNGYKPKNEGGERWNTIVLAIWNLLLIKSGYLLRLDINLIGGDLLGSSGHLVLFSSQEKWEMPINPERVWVLGSALASQDSCAWPPFLSVIQSWFPARAPFAGRIWGRWVAGFLVYFFSPSFWVGDWFGFLLLWLCFVSFWARSILATRIWKDWRMPPIFPWGLDLCILSWAEVIPHSLANQ